LRRYARRIASSTRLPRCSSSSLFFYLSVATPALPSFPTRRSSDLAGHDGAFDDRHRVLVPKHGENGAGGLGRLIGGQVPVPGLLEPLPGPLRDVRPADLLAHHRGVEEVLAEKADERGAELGLLTQDESGVPDGDRYLLPVVD